jgi:hypothetical protein
MRATLLVALAGMTVCTAQAQFIQKPLSSLSHRDASPNGQTALGLRPAAWLHSESPHFVLHYRRITEAKKVALEIEYHLAFVARVLGAAPDRYARKSHVFIFEDENDWKTFLAKTPIPPWSASFALGDELYLNVRDGRTGMFDSQTLAHETTHAVVARLYPGQPWPLWLNEGFAEHMSGLSVGARMGQYNPRLMQRLHLATLPLDQLTALTAYPVAAEGVAQLYQSSERLVRFLMTNQPADRFPRFVDALLAGDTLQTAVPKIYGDRFPTFAVFVKRYELFK